MAVARTRNYACVVYPESAPDDWQIVLNEQFVPAFVSPLHDRDIDPQGQPKKEHYHVMIMYDNVKTSSQARELFDKIGGVGCEVVQSIRGYARYLCHLDNPEKHKYDIVDVKSLCGADYMSIISLVTDKYVAIGEMIDFCDDNNIYSYSDLLRYCRNNKYEWFKILCDNGTFVIKEYLQSKMWTKNNLG